MTASTLGSPSSLLSSDEVIGFVHQQLDGLDIDGRSVCVLVPDATRVCPVPLVLGALHAALHKRVTRLTVLIALGTHGAMSPAALADHLGYAGRDPAEVYPGMEIRNHEWWDPATFADLGTIPSARIAELSEGRMTGDVEVLLNRAVVEHDVAIVVGPVLPHEVVGMSGGNKYFFPGVGGQRIIDVSHWLGALITSAEIIGTTSLTPVRALINDGAALIPAAKYAFSLVTATSGGLHSISFGDTISSWEAAARISAATHVTYLDAPVKRVLSLIPPMYDEIWTGAKGFYKVEPIVADGGEVILYAPHITEIASSHPEIYEIGYHCRDYFVKQWDRFKHIHWGVLAHSTHLRGAGTFDPAAVGPGTPASPTSALPPHSPPSAASDLPPSPDSPSSASPGSPSTSFPPHSSWPHGPSSAASPPHGPSSASSPHALSSASSSLSSRSSSSPHARSSSGAPLSPPDLSDLSVSSGVERLRVRVTLATGIPEEVCRSVNLGYLDPATVDPVSFAAEPGNLVVPRAGEVLFRLR